MRDARSWLLLTTSTSGATASLRVTVWRRLRGLGALYLQSSVCLLPDRPAIRTAADGLHERVLRDAGSMRALPMQVRDAQTHAGLVAELDTARDLEYAEVLERLPTGIAELGHERERGRLTLEEVEESEVDLARFAAWVERIAARDYFDAPLRTQVDLALTEATQALRDFEASAMQADNSGGADDARSERTRLHAVGEDR